jgi:peptidoglycan/LPS O-acetylase OafA/YrhL
MVGFAYCTPFLLSLFNLSSSSEGYEPNWLLSLLFLENYQIISTGSHPNVSPLTVMWSLCIEEHFYMVWGILLYFISIKKTPVLIIGSIIVSLIANLVFLKLGILNQEILTNLWYFAFGAIPAYLLVRYQGKFELFIQQISSVYKTTIIILTILYVFLAPWLSFNNQILVEPIIFGILFAAVICIIIPDKNSFRIGDCHFLSRWGVYTYGLYIYHTIVINFLLQAFKRFHLSPEQPLHALLLILISLFVTILISRMSYQLFERPFLQFKKYFY